MDMQEEVLNLQEQEMLPLTTFQSDDFLEKLKILGYEKYLLKDLKMKPLSRFYFVKSVNPGEQFFMFTLICWWLFKQMGTDMRKPREFDDPHDVITTIMQLLEDIDVPVNFQHKSLMRGAGPICLFVLDSLAMQTLKIAKVSCQPPQIMQEDEYAMEYLDNNAEVMLENLEDIQSALPSDDSDVELDRKSFMYFKHNNKVNVGNHRSDAKDPPAAKMLMDLQQWRLELESMFPYLKVSLKGDVRDWSSRFGQIEMLKSNIEQIFDPTQAQLKKLHSEFTFRIDKIESREKHLNTDLGNLINALKAILMDVSNVRYEREQIRENTEKVMEQLNEIISENGVRKVEMEQRGQIMSDGSSLINIKKAIAKLKEDVSQMNFEIVLMLYGMDQDIIHFRVNS